jgi:archaellum component FlaC
MNNHTQIINALKTLGADVDESTFSKKMEDPKFVERVRSSLLLGGAEVPDSSTFHQKYVNVSEVSNLEQLPKVIESKSEYQPVTTPEREEIIKPESDFKKSLREDLSMIFPRLSEAEGTERLISPEIGKNIIKSFQDIGSYPGRLLTSVGKGIIKGSPIEDVRKDVTKTEGNIVEDVLRSPYNLIPGVGEIPGIAKLVAGVGSKIPTIVSNPAVQGLSKAFGEGILSTGVGSLDRYSNNQEQNTLTDLSLGTLFGGIPGIAKFAKEKNIESIGKVVADRMQPIEFSTKQIRNLGKGFVNKADKLYDELKQVIPELKVPKETLKKVEQIPQLVESLPENIKNLTPNINKLYSELSQDIGQAAKKLKEQKNTIGVEDLLLTGAGATLGQLPFVALISNQARKHPELVEKISENTPEIAKRLIRNIYRTESTKQSQ